ncbi:MAG: SurA N-terminal domain-containing protein [Nitrosomonas sp.]|nr:SurA N-terminal domain-containing protein [Nitrosomonas sp.]
MFDFVNRKKRIVQIVLFLAVLPFMFWGVQSYRSDGSEGYVASVDGDEIKRREFEQALRDHQSRIRAMFGGNFDSAMLDSYEIKDSVLERLIQQRLLFKEAVSNGFTVLDSHLVNEIKQIPDFQVDNQFSKKQYETLLRNNGLSPLDFEAGKRQELLLEQLLDGYSENNFVSSNVVNKFLYLSEVQREIEQKQIRPEDFFTEIEPTEDQIAAYYNDHQADFYLPERVRVEYIVLSFDALADNEVVSEDAVLNYYQTHQQEFGQAEERKASHILISVSAAAAEEEKKRALEKAEDVLEQVQQNPERFTALAEEYSDDPGSASQGGDLGFFGRGVMVKAFEEVIFDMQPGEIRGPVETDFGYHIIQLTEIKEATTADLEEVRNQIEKNLKIEMVGSIFGEAVEDFGNTVYEQNDSLQPAADKFELTVQQSEWITRNSAESAMLQNPDLLAAIFSDDAILKKHNTNSIEVAPNTFVSARILEHRQETSQSLSIVSDEIVERLKKQLAAEKALKRGEEMLAGLVSGKADTIEWSESKRVSYMQSQDLNQDTIREIFKTDASTLPAYVGIANPEGGYSLIRISKIIEPKAVAEDNRTNFSRQLQQMMAQEETAAYLNGLRQRYDVIVKRDSY